MRRFWLASLLFIVQIFLVLGFWVSPALALTSEQKLVNEAWRIVNRAYLDETFNHQNWWQLRQQILKRSLSDRQATYAAIREMLGNLNDPFTRLLVPDQYRSLQVSTSGELTGIGLQIAIEAQSEQLQVIAPLEGSPAEAAGLRPLDIILAIDGVTTQGMSLDEAAERMRGPVGSPVTLSVARSGQDSFDLNLVRSRISLNPVVAELRSITTEDRQTRTIGYLRLSQFNANATQDLAAGINRLQKAGASAFILDLRNNPGGLLQAGIEIARLWLEEGPIVFTVNRQGVLSSFDANHSNATDAPLVVLVNEGTASASEILAGALQDHQRGYLIGEKTFGKGLIQSLFELSDGAGLAVTVAKYETPNHHDINKLGITPDQVVHSPPLSQNQFATAADSQYQAALDFLRQQGAMAQR